MKKILAFIGVIVAWLLRRVMMFSLVLALIPHLWVWSSDTEFDLGHGRSRLQKIYMNHHFIPIKIRIGEGIQSKVETLEPGEQRKALRKLSLTIIGFGRA